MTLAGISIFRLRTLALLTILGLSTAAAQHSARPFTISPFLEVRRFAWEERVDGGRFLQEIGPRFALGLTSRLWFFRRELLFTELEIAGSLGKVEYDGARTTLEGGYIPYSTWTAYSAIDGTLLLGSTLRPFASFLITPVAGFGMEYWIRNLDYNGPYGYTEKYVATLLGGGLRLTALPNGAVQIYMTGYVGFPLSISETFNLALHGQQPFEVVLHPANSPRYKAGFGVSLHHFFVFLSYETWTLGRSDINRQYYQPESRRDEYGLRIGYTIGL